MLKTSLLPARNQPNQSEAARIVVDKASAIVERELDVVVARGEFGVVEVLAAMGQAAAHPQMHDHRGAVAKLDDQVFGAAAKALDTPALDAGRKVMRHLAPQTRLRDARVLDSASDR